MLFGQSISAHADYKQINIGHSFHRNEWNVKMHMEQKVLSTELDKRNPTGGYHPTAF